MRIDDMILISVDDHILEPPGMFDAHVPDRWKDHAPRLVHKEDGTDMWVFQGIEVPNIGLGAVAGRPPEEYSMDPTSYADIRAGCYDQAERVKDMNLNGVLASMCFPSFAQYCGQLFYQVQDKEISYVMLQAYNDWHIDEWCGSHPGRFIPLAVLPFWDPELTAQEISRVAAKGCTAVTFSEDPSKFGLPSLHSEHWDPFYAACAEHGIRICMHTGSTPRMVYLKDAPIEVMMSLQPVNIMQTFVNILWSPLLKRFPDLRFALSEGGIGWVPYALERCDYVYQRQRFWTHQDFGDRLPSELAREIFVFCFIEDHAGVGDRSAAGVETLCWECDYPHADSTWPHAPESLMKHFAGVSDRDINLITHENAMRAFRFDPFRYRSREECTVGALRGLEER